MLCLFSIYNISFELSHTTSFKKKKKKKKKIKKTKIPNIQVLRIKHNHLFSKTLYLTLAFVLIIHFLLQMLFQLIFASISTLETILPNNTLETHQSHPLSFYKYAISSSPILHILHYSKLSSINSPSYPCNLYIHQIETVFLIPCYLFSHSTFISF